MRRVAALALPVVAVAAVLGGCSSSSSSSSKAPSSAAPATTAAAGGGAAAASPGAITIKNFAFSPSPVKAKPGATVAVSNADGTAHTVTADDKSFDTKRVEGGAKAMVTAPTKPGTYSFHCDIHDYMKGSLVVG